MRRENRRKQRREEEEELFMTVGGRGGSGEVNEKRMIIWKRCYRGEEERKKEATLNAKIASSSAVQCCVDLVIFHTIDFEAGFNLSIKAAWKQQFSFLVCKCICCSELPAEYFLLYGSCTKCLGGTLVTVRSWSKWSTPGLERSKPLPAQDCTELLWKDIKKGSWEVFEAVTMAFVDFCPFSLFDFSTSTWAAVRFVWTECNPNQLQKQDFKNWCVTKNWVVTRKLTPSLLAVCRLVCHCQTSFTPAKLHRLERSKKFIPADVDTSPP